MPQQIIVGPQCGACDCPDTVTFVTNVFTGGQILASAGPPVDPPPNPQIPATDYDTVNFTIYGWNITSQTWIQLAGGNAQMLAGSGPPLNPPANPNAPAMYYNIAAGGVVSLWDFVNHVWF